MKKIIALLLCALLLVGCTKAEQSTSTSSATSTQQPGTSSTTSASSSGTGTAAVAPPVLPQTALHELEALAREGDGVFRVVYTWGREVYYLDGEYGRDMGPITGDIFRYSLAAGEADSIGPYQDCANYGYGDYIVMPNGCYYEFTDIKGEDGEVYTGVMEIDGPGGAVQYYRTGDEIGSPMPQYMRLDEHTFLVFYSVRDSRHRYRAVSSFNTQTKRWTELYVQQWNIGVGDYVEMLDNVTVVGGRLLLFITRVAQEDVDADGRITGPTELVVDVCDLHGNVQRRIESPDFKMPGHIKVLGDLLYMTDYTQNTLKMFQFTEQGFSSGASIRLGTTRQDSSPDAVSLPGRNATATLDNLHGQFDAGAFPYLYLGMSTDSVLYLQDVRTGEIGWLQLFDHQKKGHGTYSLHADTDGNLCVSEWRFYDAGGSGTKVYYITADDIITHMEPCLAGR